MVISIIGILAAMATLSFTSAQKQARDTTRKSDLVQYRTALESFANKNNGLYPTSKAAAPIGSTDPVNLCATLELTNCPLDPKSPDYNYSYLSEPVGNPQYSAAATKYILWARLENISPTTYWVVCSSGESGKATSAPTDATCPTLTP